MYKPFTSSHEPSHENFKYLQLLSEKYPSMQSAFTEIINLTAILNLPKGTEHFMSDLHGEYEAFYHILNNCSGVVREKVDMIFGDRLNSVECANLCTLIYYPEEKLEQIKLDGQGSPEWYKLTLQNLILLAKVLSSKYTRSKVRKALPSEFSYIIDELLHAQPDEDNNQLAYHEKIIDTIVGLHNSDAFIIALAALIKRLAVDHLHIVGDIYDRGSHADRIIDILQQYHSLDIEWGNHDILWMGAAAGSEACIAATIRNNLPYNNMEILENGYGISLRSLALFAEKNYTDSDPMAAAAKAISILLFKLEGQIIKRHPEYGMEDRLLLDKIDYASGTVNTAGRNWPLEELDFPTVDRNHPYRLTGEEEELMRELKGAFTSSERLNRHVRFLYSHGSIYRCFNRNLLYHGCIPLDENGNFDGITIDGNTYHGKAYMDYADRMARQAYTVRSRDHLDFMWYLWCGNKSPLCGKTVKTFERTFIADKTAWEEPQNYYYRYCNSEKTCSMILQEFCLYSPSSRIVNGHTPVKAADGESPIKAGGKLIVIDGGFCKAYQHTTGIAGYTLIFNSHGMRIKSHRSFESMEKVLLENKDIESKSQVFFTESSRLMVKDTDTGKKIADKVRDLDSLVTAYQQNIPLHEQ